MTKNPKRKLLFITVFLMMLLSSSAYTTFIPKVHAAELTTQEKAMSILDDVVGLNVTAYTTRLSSDMTNEFWGLPQKEADFRLTSNQGGLRTRCSFINNRLHQIYISDYSGSPSLTQPISNEVDMAKGFLQRYQNYAGDPFYGELGQMLDTVSTSQNVTKTMGNVELEVSVFNEAKIDLTWRYISEHNIPAPSKSVLLSYDDGLLQSFLDNWHLFTIANCENKLSAEEAIAIAVKGAKNFSYELDTGNGTTTISDFKIEAIGKTSLCYLNYMTGNSTRSGDPFTLYPSWYVPLGFDKFTQVE